LESNNGEANVLEVFRQSTKNSPSNELIILVGFEKEN